MSQNQKATGKQRGNTEEIENKGSRKRSFFSDSAIGNQYSHHKYCKILYRIRTLDRLQYVLKIHPRALKTENLLLFNELHKLQTRVQLPPAPPKFSIGDYQSHPMKS